jgi:hypothetical protein
MPPRIRELERLTRDVREARMALTALVVRIQEARNASRLATPGHNLGLAERGGCKDLVVRVGQGSGSPEHIKA